MCVIVGQERGIQAKWVHEIIRLCPDASADRLAAGHVEITAIIALESMSERARVYVFHRGPMWDLRSSTDALIRPPARWLADALRSWPERSLEPDREDPEAVLLRVGTETMKAYPYTVNLTDRDVVRVWPAPGTEEVTEVAEQYDGDIPYTRIEISGFAPGREYVLALDFKGQPRPSVTPPDEVVYPVMGPLRFRSWAQQQILLVDGQCGADTPHRSRVSQNFDPAMWLLASPITDVAVMGMPGTVSYFPIGGSEHLARVFPLTWLDGVAPPAATTVSTAYAYSPSVGDFEFWVAARLTDRDGHVPPVMRWIEEAVGVLMEEAASSMLLRCAADQPVTREQLRDRMGDAFSDEVLDRLLTSALLRDTEAGIRLTLIGEQVVRRGGHDAGPRRRGHGSAGEGAGGRNT